MSEIWEARRKELEKKLRENALNLAQHMGAGAILLRVPDTSPQLYIFVGTAEDIKALLPKE